MHIYKLKMRKLSHKTSCHQAHFQNQKCAKMPLLPGIHVCPGPHWRRAVLCQAVKVGLSLTLALWLAKLFIVCLQCLRYSVKSTCLILRLIYKMNKPTLRNQARRMH